MFKLCFQLIRCSSIALVTCLIPAVGTAQPLSGPIVPANSPSPGPSTPPGRLTTPRNALDQVTSVSQLSDVQPTDWAFQALQSLVERYGCIAGYPDGTYRGNRPMTRYEFAAGLNACMDRVNELIAAGTANAATREDLETLQRLQAEFSAELATLRGRVDVLEARTSQLMATQFSTTTRLAGEALFGVVSVLAGDNANGQPAPQVPTFGYRVRLNLETSFTGKDLLTTRLQANNIIPLSDVLLTNEGRVEFDGTSNNQAILGLLRYRFPLGPRTNFYLAGTGNGFVDLDASSQLNPYFDGGAVSLFGLRNPIYNYTGGTGFGLRHFFTDALELNLGYLASSANLPTPGNGLFNGNYGALAQLIVNISDQSRFGFTYINTYNPATNLSFGTATGSNLSNNTFGTSVIANAYGFSGTFQFSPNFALGGWVGYSNQRYIGRGDAEVWNWAVTIAFPDIGRKGNLGGLLVGMEPKVTGIRGLNNGQADRDTSLHLEAFYRYRFSDNIAVTPGVIWITSPNHDDRNADTVIGVIRTVFLF